MRNMGPLGNIIEAAASGGIVSGEGNVQPQRKGISSLYASAPINMDDDETDIGDNARSGRASLIGILFGACGGLVASTSLLFRSYRCGSQNPCRPRTSNAVDDDLEKRYWDRRKRGLFDPETREGETVAIPVKSPDCSFGVDESISFDDNISALSAHTLNNMVPASPTRATRQAGKRKGSATDSPPRDGDVLVSTVTPDNKCYTNGGVLLSPAAIKRTTGSTGKTSRRLEKFDPVFFDADRSSLSDVSKKSHESNPATVWTSGSSSNSEQRKRSTKSRKTKKTNHKHRSSSSKA